MALNKWFGPGKGEGSAELTVDDLIALERYEEAEQRLKALLRSDPKDLHSRLRLAEVLRSLRRGSESVDEYLGAADAYARDGFYDKATALLTKVSRLAPGDEKVQLKIQAVEMAKRLEKRRDLVIESLLASRRDADSHAGTSAFELKRLWSKITGSPLIEQLSDRQLSSLFQAFEIENLEEDAEIAAEGESKEVIYLLGRGEIEVRISVRTGVETVLRGYSPGDLIGDRALLEHQPWPARHVASTPSTVFRLDRQGLEKALMGESDPRSLLDALRAQRHDHEVVEMLTEMNKGEG